MAIRTILAEPDELLRKSAKEVKAFNDHIKEILNDMAETMYDSDGVGIAAPQVGILRRMFIVDIGEGPVEFINPEIIEKSEETENGMEGCLSVPGKFGWVERPTKIRIRAFDRNGDPFELEAEDFFARAIQHEYDHLDGTLYIDIMERFLTDKELEEMED